MQSEADSFYGNPHGRNARMNQAWYRSNITMIMPPFKMHMVGPISKFPIHIKCSAAASDWLDQVWKNAGRDQGVIDQWGMSVFFRLLLLSHYARPAASFHACLWLRHGF